MAVTGAIGAIGGAIIGGIRAAKSGDCIWKGALTGAAVGGLAGLGLGAITGILVAGSALASVTSVAVGVNALTSTIGSAGVIAGAKMIADNVSQACNGVPQVFWSGGDVAKDAAKQVAANVGGKTLEITRLGVYLEQVNASYGAWQAASSNFANVASNTSNTIYSVHNSIGVGIHSIWAQVEYPLLQGCNIIYGVVQQTGIIQLLK